MQFLKYNVIFHGRLVDGADPAAVRAALGQTFRLPADRLERLFDGGRHAIKRGIAFEEAVRFKELFKQAGAVVELEPVEETPPVVADAPQAAAAPAAPAAWACPKCGFEQERTPECRRCGVIVAKFLAAREQGQVQQAQAGETPALPNVKAKALEWLVQMIRDWIRTHRRIALVVLLVLPFFGGSLVISTAFFERAQHVIYLADKPSKACADFEPFLGNVNKPVYPHEQALFHEASNGYKDTIGMAAFTEAYGYKVCAFRYTLDVGNVGSEPLRSVRVEFDDDRLRQLFPDARPERHISHVVMNLSSGSPREGDPVIRREGEYTYRIDELPVGALVSIRFVGWQRAEDRAPGFDDLLTAVAADGAKVQTGDPRATSFVRALTWFF